MSLLRPSLASPQATAPDEATRPRWQQFALLLLIILVPPLLYLTAQLAIQSTLIRRADTDALSRLSADYSPWPYGRYLPVDPAIIDAAAADRAALGLLPGDGSGLAIAELRYDLFSRQDEPAVPPRAPTTTAPPEPTATPPAPAPATSVTPTPPPPTPPPTPPPGGDGNGDGDPPPSPPQGGTISGFVFEAVSYSGGAGTAFQGGIDRLLQQVRVRLFGSDSVQVGADVFTDANGQFSFSVGFDDLFTVHVVSSSIGDADTPPAADFNTGFSSAVAEQTYESDAVSGNGGPGALGGDDPRVADTLGPGPGDTTIQVTVASANVAGLQMGFSYNLVVNPLQSGPGSLDRFIQNANAVKGENEAHFAIPASNPATDPYFDGTAFTIEPPVDGFDPIDDPDDMATTIDATTQPGGYDIIVDGTNANSDVSGFVLVSDNNTLNGLTIQDFNNGGSATGVLVRGDANTVSDNTLTNNVTTPMVGTIGSIDIRADSAPGSNVPDDVVVSGNTITGSNGDGVRIADTTSNRITITDNIITDSAAEGMTVRGDALVVTDNTISGTARQAGIEMAAVNNSLFDGNTIAVSSLTYDPNGMSLSDSSSNNTIRNNTIRNNDGDGIAILDAGSTGNQITGNSIANNAGLGINLGAGVSGGTSAPAIGSASLDGSNNLVITGTAASGAEVEVYVVTDTTPDSCGGSPCGEGGIPLNTFGDFTEGDLAEDGDPVAGQFSFTVPAASVATAGLTSGDAITTTAQDTPTDNTSEFSINETVTP